MLQVFFGRALIVDVCDFWHCPSWILLMGLPSPPPPPLCLSPTCYTPLDPNGRGVAVVGTLSRRALDDSHAPVTEGDVSRCRIPVFRFVWVLKRSLIF